MDMFNRIFTLVVLTCVCLMGKVGGQGIRAQLGRYEYTLFTTPQTHTEASFTCSDMGGHLVSIYSNEVQSHLSSFLTQYLDAGSAPGGVWTSGKEMTADTASNNHISLWRWLGDFSGQDANLDIQPVPGASLRAGRGVTVTAVTDGGLLDLAVVLDDSGSISQTPDAWGISKQLMRSLVQLPNVITDPDHVRVGCVTFGHNAYLKFGLNDTISDVTLEQAIKNLVNTSAGDTYTNTALALLRTELFTARRGSRAQAPDAAVLLTDGGATNLNLALDEVQRLHDAGIRLYIVGIGSGIHEAELRALSAPPRKRDITYWVVNSFQNLQTTAIAQSIMGQIDYWNRLNTIATAYAVENQGCFYSYNITNYNSSVPRQYDLPYEVGALPITTPLTCREACRLRQFLFSAVTFNDLMGQHQCRCGARFGRWGASRECTTQAAQCPDDTTQFCGTSDQHSILLTAGGEYVQWQYAQPNNYNQKQTCGALAMDRLNPALKFADEHCDQEYPFICQLPSAACNSTTLLPPVEGRATMAMLGDKCVYLSGARDARSWFQADNYCQSHAGLLLVVAGPGEHAALRALLAPHAGYRAALGLSTRFAYIGLHRNTLFWLDDNNGTEMVYTNFRRQGSGLDTTKACVYLYPGDNYRWGLDACDTVQKQFVCQKDIPQITTTSTTKQTTTTIMPQIIETTTAVDQIIETTTAGQASPQITGAASTQGNSFMDNWWILLVVCIVIVIVLIIVLIWYFKFHKKPKVMPSLDTVYDCREKAPTPYGVPFAYEAYEEMGTNVDDKLIGNKRRQYGEKYSTNVYTVDTASSGNYDFNADKGLRTNMEYDVTLWESATGQNMDRIHSSILID